MKILLKYMRTMYPNLEIALVFVGTVRYRGEKLCHGVRYFNNCIT